MNILTQGQLFGRYRRVAGFCLGFLLAAWLRPANGYVLQGQRWPTGEPIVMHLQLGSPGSVLIDGSTSWNQVAEAALDIWNPSLAGGVQFEVSLTTVKPVQGDGVNSVFFSNTVYGEDFGDDTLGVTLSYDNPTTNVKTEADVIFNNAVSFNSYRGTLIYNATGQGIYDLRRVALHEFGHVLGLDHVPQNATSIMTPFTTGIDTIQADDIAGVEAIYGPVAAPVFTSATTTSGQTSQAFSYQIVAAEAFSYAAVGLPAGLTLDTTTGLITGTPQADGVYTITLEATNPIGASTGTLTLTVLTPPTITSSLTAYARLNQPFTYPIEASHQTTSFAATGLPAGLSIDAASGVIVGTPTDPGTFSVGLSAANATGAGTATLVLKVEMVDDSLVFLHTFQYAEGVGNSDPPIQAADGNLYGATSNGGPGGSGTVYKMTPDGTLTTLYAFANDKNGGTPGPRLVQAADGSFYGVTGLGGVLNGGTIFRLTPDGVLTVLHDFNGAEGRGPNALIQASDGNFYGTTAYTNVSDGSVSIFRLTPDGTFTALQTLPSTSPLTVLSSLIQGNDGNLYGSIAGSRTGAGAIFRCALDGTLTILYQFPGDENGASNGWSPGTLVQASDGNFYGTTEYGGANGAGTIFRLTSDGTLTTLHDFTAIEAGQPSPLIQATDGNLYGTAFNGGDSTSAGPSAGPIVAKGQGAIFAMTLGGQFATLYVFDGTGGFNPSGGLIQGGDGYLYGATLNGYSSSRSTVFRKGIVALPALNPSTTTPVATTPTATLVATTPTATIGSGDIGELTLSLSEACPSDVIINLVIKGTAINGTDYTLLKSTKKIKAGQTSKPIKVIPQGDLGGASKKTVKLVLEPGTGYTVGTTDKVKVSILAGQ